MRAILDDTFPEVPFGCLLLDNSASGTQRSSRSLLLTFERLV